MQKNNIKISVVSDSILGRLIHDFSVHLNYFFDKESFYYITNHGGENVLVLYLHGFDRDKFSEVLEVYIDNIKNKKLQYKFVSFFVKTLNHKTKSIKIETEINNFQL